MPGREWSYWTRNKLEILTEYLPVFTGAASKKASERIYLDLMAGQPKNRERHTGVEFDGSPVVALTVNPPFSRLRFCELGNRADQLAAYLKDQFPGDDRYKVVSGDCNITIDAILQELAAVRWAPTFAFVDQQAAEVHWRTLTKLASFRKNAKGWKTEIWILMSPTMILKGVRGTNNEAFQARVDQLYGNTDWRRIQRAFDRHVIVAREYRQQMVNLMRFQLENDLGYAYSHRIPMQMHNKLEIYDMVFATDHDVGDRVMQHLYNKAAQREPEMLRQAKLAKAEKEIELSGQPAMFDASEFVVNDANAGQVLWSPTPCWNPAEEHWWFDDSDPDSRH